MLWAQLKIFLLFLGGVALVQAPMAHEYYVSYTNISYNPNNASLEIIMKITAHDLEKVLESEGAETLKLGSEKEHPKADEWIEKYLNQNLELVLNGKEVQYEYLGKKVHLDETLEVFLEIKEVRQVNQLKIRNTILFDYFPVQENIINLSILGKELSAVTTRGHKERIFNIE